MGYLVFLVHFCNFSQTALCPLPQSVIHLNPCMPLLLCLPCPPPPLPNLLQWSRLQETWGGFLALGQAPWAHGAKLFRGSFGKGPEHSGVVWGQGSPSSIT